MNPAVLALVPFDVEDEPEPHAELVAAQRVSAADIVRAAGIIGAFPSASYLGGEARLLASGA